MHEAHETLDSLIHTHYILFPVHLQKAEFDWEDIFKNVALHVLLRPPAAFLYYYMSKHVMYEKGGREEDLFINFMTSCKAS